MFKMQIMTVCLLQFRFHLTMVPPGWCRLKPDILLRQLQEKDQFSSVYRDNMAQIAVLKLPSTTHYHPVEHSVLFLLKAMLSLWVRITVCKSKPHVIQLSSAI